MYTVGYFTLLFLRLYQTIAAGTKMAKITSIIDIVLSEDKAIRAVGLNAMTAAMKNRIF